MPRMFVPAVQSDASGARSGVLNRMSHTLRRTSSMCTIKALTNQQIEPTHYYAASTYAYDVGP